MKTNDSHPRSSRQRYRVFVRDYKEQRLDDPTESGKDHPPATEKADSKSDPQSRRLRRGKRRQCAREYLGWLLPYRYTVAAAARVDLRKRLRVKPAVLMSMSYMTGLSSADKFW